MAIRVACPFCKTANVLNDDKRGKKVPCRGCKKALNIPAAKKADDGDEGIQEPRQTKLQTKPKAAPKRTMLAKADDYDDAPPVKKKKNKKEKVEKKGPPLLLILGGAGALLFLLLIGGAAIAGYLIWRSKNAPAPQVADSGERPREEEKKTTTEPVQKKESTPEKKQDATPPPKKEPSDLLRNSANLTVNHFSSPERTVKMQGTFKFFTLENGQNNLALFKIDTDLLEVMSKHPEGALMRTGFGPLDVSIDFGGKVNPLPIDAIKDAIKPNPPTYVVDLTNKMKKRTLPDFAAAVPMELRDPSAFIQDRIWDLLEAGMLQMPNKNVMLDETWSSDGLLIIREGRQDIQLRLVLDCKYEGTKTKPTFAGLITVKGRLQAPADPKLKKYDAAVTGTFLFGLAEGFIKSGQLKISNEAEGGDGKHTYSMDINLQRRAGNPLNIKLPADPVPVAKTDPPADLTVNNTNPKERTAKLKGTFKKTTLKNDKKVVTVRKIDADVLEVMSKDPLGALMKTGFGPITASAETDGQPVTIPNLSQSLDLIRKSPPTYVLDPTNRRKTRTLPELAATVAPDLRNQTLALQGPICYWLEAGIIQMPNKKVMPGETWSAAVPLAMRDGTQIVDFQMVLTCKYEGTKTDPRSAGSISVTGRLQTPDPKYKQFNAVVTGNLLFDLAGGYLSSTQLKISNEAELTLGGDVKDVYTLDIDIQRQAGNPGNIQLPVDAPVVVTKDPPAPKTLIPFQNSAVLPSDPVDPKHPAAPKSKVRHNMKVFGPVQLQMGKSYTISVNSTFDAHIRIENQAGQVVHQGGSGAMPRVTYRATTTGPHRIIVTPGRAGTYGGFQIMMQEAP